MFLILVIRLARSYDRPDLIASRAALFLTRSPTGLDKNVRWSLRQLTMSIHRGRYIELDMLRQLRRAAPASSNHSVWRTNVQKQSQYPGDSDPGRAYFKGGEFRKSYRGDDQDHRGD